MINYKQLLVKYMAHVGNEEGICFIPSQKDRLFTAEEIAELNRIFKDCVQNRDEPILES